MKKAEVDKLEVEFKTKISKYDNCSCDGCHDVAKVAKIRLPHTKYHNGTHLTTNYKEYWLCVSCKKKLLKSLNQPEKE